MSTTIKQSYFANQGQSEIVRLNFLYDAEKAHMEPRAKYPDSGLRALALRHYCGFPARRGDQKKFADWVGGGISSARWGMIETGKTPFSDRVFQILRRRLPWLEWDWLREGTEGKMPPQYERPLLQILAKLRNANTAQV